MEAGNQSFHSLPSVKLIYLKLFDMKLTFFPLVMGLNMLCFSLQQNEFNSLNTDVKSKNCFLCQYKYL